MKNPRLLGLRMEGEKVLRPLRGSAVESVLEDKPEKSGAADFPPQPLCFLEGLRVPPPQGWLRQDCSDDEL